MVLFRVPYIKFPLRNINAWAQQIKDYLFGH